MPNIKSAKKRMELSRKARERNRARRTRLRSAIKEVRQTTDADEARSRLEKAYALLDRAAGNRLVHPNKAARTKSRLAEYVRKLSEAGEA